MVKALLLAVWHDLSDVTLAEVLDDRACFRRFCGFSASEADDDGRWVKHKGRAAVRGFKAHVGADANTALSRRFP
jgi:IS5 family transposase